MSYSPEILAVACPACNAAPTAKCYNRVRDGSKHREDPHQERRWAAGYRPSVVLAFGITEKEGKA